MQGLAKVRTVSNADSSGSSRRPLLLAATAGAALLLAGILYLRDSGAPQSTSAVDASSRVDEPQQRSDRLDRLKQLREAHAKAEGRTGSSADGNTDGGRMRVQGAAPMDGGRVRPRPNAPVVAGNGLPMPADETNGTTIDEDPDDIPSLRKMALDDNDPERRLAAVTLLGASDDPQAIPILAQALQDKDEEVRLAAIQSLADVTGEVPVDVLGNAALNDPSADNRYEALEVLSDVGGEAARRIIEKATTDPDEDVSEFAKGLMDTDEEDNEAAPAPEQPAAH